MEFVEGKPVCELSNSDGNVFMIISLVSKTLKKAGHPDEAAEFQKKAMASESYEAVLTLCETYVEVM